MSYAHDFLMFKEGFLSSGCVRTLLDKCSFFCCILSKCSCFGTIDLYVFKSSVFAITCDR